MGGLTNVRDMLMGGKTSDGVSMQTHKAMKEASVGPYDAPPPASVAPKETNIQNQVGSTKITNESGLRSALKARGFSDSEVDRQVAQYKASTGLR